MQEAFHRVYQAFETLADARLRSLYDGKLSEREKRPAPSGLLPYADEALLQRIEVYLQRLQRGERFEIIRSDFSQRQRLLFEKWMSQPKRKKGKRRKKPQRRPVLRRCFLLGHSAIGIKNHTARHHKNAYISCLIKAFRHRPRVLLAFKGRARRS